MTIYELSLSYEQTASILWARIKELDRMSEMETDPMVRETLISRVRPIRAMYRDTRKTARYLTNYYSRRSGK